MDPVVVSIVVVVNLKLKADSREAIIDSLLKVI
jgi:hypothetical protein